MGENIFLEGRKINTWNSEWLSWQESRWQAQWIYLKHQNRILETGQVEAAEIFLFHSLLRTGGREVLSRNLGDRSVFNY